MRYFNIFGPRQAPDSPYSGVMAKFPTLMLESEQPWIFGHGVQSRDFTYIENVVQANLKAAAAPAEKRGGAQFDTPGRAVYAEPDLQADGRAAGYKNPPKYGPPREGDIQHSYADISAAREALGYDPKIGFLEGLQRTVEWYREQRQAQSRKAVGARAWIQG